MTIRIRAENGKIKVEEYQSTDPVKIIGESSVKIGQLGNLCIIIGANSGGIVGEAVFQPKIINALDTHACTEIRQNLSNFFDAILSQF